MSSPTCGVSPPYARWRQLATAASSPESSSASHSVPTSQPRLAPSASRSSGAACSTPVACASTRVTSWRAPSSCWPRACSVMSWNWTKNSVGQPPSSVSAVALTSIQRASPLAGDDPALRLVGADLAGQHALEQPLAHAPLLGMDGLGERALEQLGLGAPQQLAERGVDEAEAPVGADHRHPGRRVVERVHEALRRLGHADRAGAVRLAGEVGEGELDDVQRLVAAELLGGGVAQ